MTAILTKIFAIALALAQVGTRPDAVKTWFDPIRDQAEVTQLLRDGCAHMRKVFDIEAINLDALIATAVDDPKAVSSGVKALHGLRFDDLSTAYRQLCKNETVARSPVAIGEVIAFYNETLAGLPDHTKLKDQMMLGLSAVLDQNGGRFAELGEPSRRRNWVPLSDVPDVVQKAFVAAEDKRFFQHKGIDERGMIRAFVGNLAQPGRPQGGSTITQQVAKNLLVGDDVTYERKIREIIVASRLEHTLGKSEILELYLNAIYLGRGAWGIEMAAHNYFGKPARQLTLIEGALLAALAKGPTHLNPDRYPGRARDRVNYVLDRLQDSAIDPEQMRQALSTTPRLIEYSPPRRDTGFYFVDQVRREARTLAGIDLLTQSSYTVHSTVRPELQRAAEAALQEGLASYERRNNRAQFQGPEANLSDAVERIEAGRSLARSFEPGRAGTPDQGQVQGQVPAPAPVPAWRQALKSARLPLYDVHWSAAVVVALAGNGGVRVGLSDGRILPLAISDAGIRGRLKLYDVVLVQAGSKGKSATAELRVRPWVQGAALVLDNKTGGILAMTGGFSYPLSQLNRATQARRQPGSVLKPVSYLAALAAGLQPNTLVLDEPITLAPIDGSTQEENYWTPRNDGNSRSGAITLRRALENSRNLATARLLDGGIAGKPKESLERVCEVAVAAQLYSQCVPFYPFVLGAQPVRIVDLAAFYAAIANEGMRPSPHAVESIEQHGQVVYRHATAPVSMGVADPAAFYQLKSMLQGVVARGTARSIRGLAPYVAGKTGTTTDVVDAWFVGFSNDVTVAVWVGYDNADGQRRTLGDGETGNGVAVPIFESIMQAVWANHAPRTALGPPSPQARSRLVDLPIDPSSGARLRKGSAGFIEHFHLDQKGELDDTRTRLVSRDLPRGSQSAKRERKPRAVAAKKREREPREVVAKQREREPREVAAKQREQEPRDVAVKKAAPRSERPASARSATARSTIARSPKWSPQPQPSRDSFGEAFWSWGADQRRGRWQPAYGSNWWGRPY